MVLFAALLNVKRSVAFSTNTERSDISRSLQMRNRVKLIILLACYFIFFLPQYIYAGDFQKKRFIVGVVPIIPGPFERFPSNQYYDFHNFPVNLSDHADNAVLDALLHQNKQITQVDIEHDTRSFYERLRTEKYVIVDEVCLNSKPQIDILICFELDQSKETINPCEDFNQQNCTPLRIKLHAYYKKKYVQSKGKDSIERSFFHRTKRLELLPNNYQDIKQKVTEVIFTIFAEYKKTI